MIRVRILRGALIGCLIGLALAPDGLLAQDGRARLTAEEENFRREPGGRRLATVFEGATFRVVDGRNDWVEVELEGWIWSASVAATDRDGFDLVVAADGGENLRAEPQGKIVARLLEGFLLNRDETRGSWEKVRRRGWIWRQSLELSGAPVAGAQGADSGARTADAGRETATTPLLSVPFPVAIHSHPDGDTVAVFQPGGQAQVLGRTGDWIRVRMDGWVYGPAASDTALDVMDTGDLTPAQLRAAEPGRYRGAVVRWRIQFIALRHAERGRTDLEEGEPFLLALGPAGDAGFIYLAVPEELLPVAQQLRPLERVTVVGRVRTGRSALVGNPVIDLTEIEVERERG